MTEEERLILATLELRVITLERRGSALTPEEVQSLDWDSEGHRFVPTSESSEFLKEILAGDPKTWRLGDGSRLGVNTRLALR